MHGSDREAVARTAADVESIVQSILSRMPYTHFLCLPLPTFVPAFERLKADVLSSLPPCTAGLSSSIFVRPTSLHVTLAMLHLPSPSLIQHAVTTLASLLPSPSSPLVSPPPVGVRLTGLASFQRAREAHVVYAVVDEGWDGYWRVVEVCRRVVVGMVEGGVLGWGEVGKQGLLSVGGEWKGKLHVTVINTKHRRVEGEEGRGGQGGGEGVVVEGEVGTVCSGRRWMRRSCLTGGVMWTGVRGPSAPARSAGWDGTTVRCRRSTPARARSPYERNLQHTCRALPVLYRYHAAAAGAS